MPRLDTASLAPRILLCHKQKTSARLQFLRFPHGMMMPAPLPADVAIHPANTPAQVRFHPAAWTHHLAGLLKLPEHTLTVEPEFHAEAHSPTQPPITILLAQFNSIDAPRDIAKQAHAQWISITDTEGISAAELNILRLAYEHMVG